MRLCGINTLQINNIVGLVNQIKKNVVLLIYFPE
jgi:hypothetical protein